MPLRRSSLALVCMAALFGCSSTATDAAPEPTPEPNDIVQDAPLPEPDEDAVPVSPDTAQDDAPDPAEDVTDEEVAAVTCDYVGGWPCNPNKDAMADPGWEGPCPGGAGCACITASGSDVGGSPDCDSNACVKQAGRCLPATGSIAPRLTSVDQFGDAVDLYDFAGNGNPIVLSVSAGWAMAGIFESYFKDKSATPNGMNSLDGVRDAVLDGSLTWITLLIDDASMNNATAEDLAAWYESYGLPEVPVLLDPDYKFTMYYAQGITPGIPSLLVFDDQLGLLANGLHNSDEAYETLIDLVK